MKHPLLFFAVLLSGLAFHANAVAPPPLILATLFPVVDFAREVAGEYADVAAVLPPGAEAHSFSPTSADIMRLSRADAFLYVSDNMETWVPRLLATAPPGMLITALAPTSEEPEGQEEEGTPHAHSHAQDPHVWLDPLQAMEMVERIANTLSAVAPDHAAVYDANASALRNRLLELHQEIETALADCPQRTLMVGGHFAFGHFANRYGLTHISPYPGFAPNAQPSPRALAQLVKTMRENNTHALFYEEILDPKLARVLAQETGAFLLPLHSLHNLTTAEVAEAPSYFTLMRRNLENLKKGLCP
ncbi:MAG: zinc ABC transporter substrate-binding protein [Verrucomicrobiota bacterium]|jgi:zinc transport system substrate-binding protein|nr:zinc ABC transporter substrate-binding protein [Verrucomicrobiota bacterium]